MPYEYHYDIAISAWMVTLDGRDVKRFMSEDEAAIYCHQMNVRPAGLEAPDA